MATISYPQTISQTTGGKYAVFNSLANLKNNTTGKHAITKLIKAKSSSPNTLSKNTYYSFKLVKNGTTMTFYYNNTQFATKTVTWLGNYNSFDIYTLLWNATGNSISYKNVKFKKVQ